MMKNLPIYYKLITIFMMTILVAVGLVGWFGLKNTSDAYISSTYELNKQSSNALYAEIEKKLEYVPKDALYTTNFYALKKYFVWKSMGDEQKSQQWKQIFSDALVDFLETRKDYYKVRIIDNNADEILTIIYNKTLNKTTIIPQDKLQNKKGRAYVEKAKKLKKGEFFISEMNLDIENHKIMVPHLPVVRFSTPIIDDNNERIGLFVTSVYADSVLQILEKHSKESQSEHISYYLIDENGNYLYNEDETKCWNPQLHNGYNFNREFFNIKALFGDKTSGVFKRGDKIYAFHKVFPYQPLKTTYWYVVSVADTSIAFAKLEEFKIFFFILLIVVLLISIYVIRLYVLKITTPLTQVSHQLEALSRGEIKKEKIKYNAKDEVGEIVASTIKVVDAIEMTIKQANAVANGDFSRDIKLLSENDSLGESIKEMTIRLKEITKLATELSHGNYDVKIIVKGSEDKLGLALVDMVEYLKTITELMESIALGDLNIRYKARGNKDRLGRSILQMIKYLKSILKQANAISQENFSNSIQIKSSNDELGIALEKMTKILHQTSIKNKEEIYFSEGIGEFSDKITGISDKQELARQAVTTAAKHVGAASGVIYIYDKETEALNLIASYAYSSRDSLSNKFMLGDGIIGQVALEKEEILLKNIQDNEYLIKSGTTLSQPKEIFAYPLMHDGELFGVCEMMSYSSFSHIHKEYLKKSAAIFASVLHTTVQNFQIKLLLEKSQSAYEELQAQSEELQESNVQMEEQQQQLQLQSQELKMKNDVLAQAKEEINRRAEELEKASKYKNEFLANMSHELRTPLNSIILLSKLLSNNQNHNLSEKDVEKTKVINKAGLDLLMLINDILDLSKVESGNMELEEKEVSSVEIFDDLKGLFSALADEKKLIFNLYDDYKDSFMSDKTKLLQVLKNLLSNAFKFTKEGSVTLHMYKMGSRLIFKVKDSGIGIPKEKELTIFEAFKQVDGSISREFGGTGLGLSISKTIVELMGGKLSVESELGKGSVFTVDIPLKEVDIKPITQEEIPVSTFSKVSDIIVSESLEDENLKDFSLKGKNILLVDDDSRNIFALTSLLEDLDAEVFSAFNGQEAIEILEDDENIDLILMDIMMPIMDGMKAIRTIKAAEHYKNIPIIAITAKTMPDDKDDILEAGADDYLAKPIQNSALVSMLKAWIK